MPEQCRNSLKIDIFDTPRVTSMAGDKLSNSVWIGFSCLLCKASIMYQMLALLCPHEADSESARSGSHVPQLLVVLWLSNSYVYHVRGRQQVSL